MATRTTCHGLWPVYSALEAPVLYPVRVCLEGPPQCPPPIPGGTVTWWVVPSGRGELCQSSAVCVLCSRLLCPYLVCFLSLLSVIISSFFHSAVFVNYLWLSCVFIVLSVQFDFVWSTRYSSVFLSVSILPSPALPCLESLKTVYLSYTLVCVFLDSPSCLHRVRNFCKNVCMASRYLTTYWPVGSAAN